MKRYLALLLYILLGTSATAQADPAIRPLLSLGYDFGGEKLATAFYEDGEEDEVNANEGVHFAVGFSIPLANGLELMNSIGYQEASAEAENGSITWTSIPLETTLMARIGHIKIGGGTLYQVKPKFKSRGILNDLGDFEFDDTLGFQAQIAWSPSHGFSHGEYLLGMRYTAIEFETNGQTSEELDGSSTSLYLRYLF